jgi:hypothetical protein
MLTTKFLYSRIIDLVNKHDTIKHLYTRQCHKCQTSRKFSFSKTKFDLFKGQTLGFVNSDCPSKSKG